MPVLIVTVYTLYSSHLMNQMSIKDRTSNMPATMITTMPIMLTKEDNVVVTYIDMITIS